MFSILQQRGHADIVCLPDCAAGRHPFVWPSVDSRWQILCVPSDFAWLGSAAENQVASPLR